jgi:hypothetical protein
VKLSDEEWQDKVLAWVEEAGVIVFMAGTTHWADWELKQIIATGHVDKLIIVFPEAPGAPESRLKAIREAFSDSPWEAALVDVGPPLDVRSICFDRTRCIVVSSEPNSRVSYQLGALVAHYLMLQRHRDHTISVC